jgi:hypothetical protein
MKKTNFILILILFTSLLLLSCQSIKDGLSGRKSENSDEFLVQKKNPLVTPPDYMKLPKPNETSETEALLVESETDIQELLKIKKNENNDPKGDFGNAEEFVLKKIKE